MMPQNETTPSNIPRSFYCPLTMEVMVDPVIDAEGNTFERRALLQWLSHYGASPVSRQPLNSNLVVPNFALRDTIHEVMGSSWVTQQTEEMELQYSEMEDASESSIESTGSSSSSSSSSTNKKSHASKYRGKIQCYLQKLSQDVGGGMQLELDNDSGVCMFNCENMTIIVEVPADVGFFFIYTVVSVPFLSEESKDMMLEANRLQSETRGGSLSIKKHESGQYDIFFSYSDRIDEISAADFCNIVPNFIETAARLKTRFLGPGQQQQQENMSAPSMDTASYGPSSKPQERACVGMAAKFL